MAGIPHLVDPAAWSKASWLGMAFLVPQNAPPGLGFVFGNAEDGLEIFRGWRKAFPSGQDTDEILRVSLVDGAIPGQTPGYTVHVSVDLVTAALRATERGSVVDLDVRALNGDVAKRMNPKQREPLEAFKRLYAAAGKVALVPVVQRGGYEPVYELQLVKQRLLLRQPQDIVAKDDPDGPLLQAR